MMPAGRDMPKVIEAKRVPMIAATRRRKIVSGVGILPQSPRREDWALHSLKRAATSSVDCTLALVLWLR